MLYLLHGENVGASRQALIDLKKNYSPDSVSVFDAKNFDEGGFLRACETPSLLSDRRLVVVENKPPSSTIQQFNNLTIYPSVDLVFWLGEELKPSNKLFKQVKADGGQIRHFRPTIPKHVFGFLDALGYKNKQKAFLELHRLLDQGESPVYLWTMMVWEVRNLLKVQSAKGKVQNVHPYVLRKLQQQVRNFDEGELVKIFKRLLEAETALKTMQLDPVLVLDKLVSEVTQ